MSKPVEEERFRNSSGQSTDTKPTQVITSRRRQRCRIQDWPSFPSRGFMIVCSPTGGAFELVESFAGHVVFLSPNMCEDDGGVPQFGSVRGGS